MDSIDGASFVRFALWTVFLLFYYMFMELHASYDATKESEREAATMTQATNIEVRITK